jgi:Tfp pilus assembly protein PilN
MTLQQTPERRPKKIDLNLLPSEYRPPKKSYLGIILYLIIAVLICAMIPLLIMRSGINSELKSLPGTIASLVLQLSELQVNKDEADTVKSQISDVQNQLATMEEDYQSFVANRSTWSQIVTEIYDLVPGKKITLESISPSVDKVMISGISTKRVYLYDYVVSLEESDFFSNVDFTFGDCPDINTCSFSIKAPLTTLNQTEGKINE